MSYLADKMPCISCGFLYDSDLLTNDECRDCTTTDLDHYHYDDDEECTGYQTCMHCGRWTFDCQCSGL